MIIGNDPIKSLFENEYNFITNASNLASYIYHEFDNLNWVGFYFLNGDELLLGPFQGKPACIRIKVGSGVCGTAVEQKRTIIVDNVHEFPGHIACDSASNSEIVIPLYFDNIIFGVLDIDSPVLNRFMEKDRIIFENYAQVLISKSNVTSLLEYYLVS